MIEDKYQLTDEALLALIRGKKLILHVVDHFHIEIIPPTYGLKIKYEDWRYIKALLREFAVIGDKDIEGFIKMIEEEK